MSPAAPIVIRFWKGVTVKPGECWLWRYATDRDGYGRMKIAGRPMAAHRVSWEIHFGEIPGGASVLHHCDTPACVNPEHLFLGDAAANARDRQSKGRSNFQKEPDIIRRGTRHHAAKLMPALVVEMRELRAKGESYRALGRRYGISAMSARDACLGVTWADSGSFSDQREQKT